METFQARRSAHIAMPSVFLSHSSSDRVFALALAKRLRDQDVRVWLDEAELDVGDSLIDKISRAIDETDFFAVILSHASVASEWVQVELQAALQKELAADRVTVLPVLLDDAEIPLFLKDRKYADFRTPASTGKHFPLLLRTLGLVPRSDVYVREEAERLAAIREVVEEARELLEEQRRLVDRARGESEEVLAAAKELADAQRERELAELDVERIRRLEQLREEIEEMERKHAHGEWEVEPTD